MGQKVDTRSLEREIAAFMASHDGVAGRAELQALGLGDQAIIKRARSGRLHRVHRGVYSLSPSLTSRGRARAAVLACGDTVVLSHRSAAHVHGLFRSGPSHIDVTVPTANGRAKRNGITIHRCAIAPEEITRDGHIPITILARTLLDLAEIAPERILIAALDRTEDQERLDLGAVRAVLTANPHRHGAAKLRRAITAYAEGPTARSILERDFLALCAAHEIPKPTHVNHHLGPYEVDFRWPRAGLIVETDGRAHHQRRRQFTKDRVRDAEHLTQGWRTVRFTYAQIHHQPTWVAGILRRLLT